MLSFNNQPSRHVAVMAIMALALCHVATASPAALPLMAVPGGRANLVVSSPSFYIYTISPLTSPCSDNFRIFQSSLLCLHSPLPLAGLLTRDYWKSWDLLTFWGLGLNTTTARSRPLKTNTDNTCTNTNTCMNISMNTIVVW